MRVARRQSAFTRRLKEWLKRVPVALVAIWAVSAAPVNAQLLIEHFRAARLHDPQYQAAFAARDAAEQGLAAASSAFGPKVTLSGSAFRTNRVEESTNFLGKTTDTNREFSSRLAQIQARQSVYRARDNRTQEQAIAQLQSAQSILQQSEQDLGVRLVNRWIEVIAAREMVDLYTQSMNAAIESVTESEKRFRSGETTVQELDLAKARLMQAEAQLTDSKAQLQVAELMLTDIVGPKAQVPDSSRILGVGQLSHQRKADVALMDEIDQKNFEIQAARYQEEAARLEREKASADRLPTVDVYVSASKGENDSVSSVKDENRIGLQFNMPLFTSGALEAGIAQAEANYRKAQAQTRATQIRIRSEALSLNGVLTALAVRVAAADRSVRAATLALEGVHEGLRAGVNSRSEVAQANQELIGAKRQQIMIRKEYGAAWLKLQFALSSIEEPMLGQLENLLLSNAPNLMSAQRN